MFSGAMRGYPLWVKSAVHFYASFIIRDLFIKCPCVLEQCPWPHKLDTNNHLMSAEMSTFVAA